MDNVFIRNYIIFVILLIFCASSLIYGLVAGERSLNKTGNLVQQTHNVIIKAEELSSFVEGMLAAHRGYLLTNDDLFLKEYEDKKANVSEHIAELSALTSEEPSQQSRLDEIRNYFGEFSTKLESRTQVKEPLTEEETTTNNVEILKDVEAVNNFRNNITRINGAILKEAYTMLNERVQTLENKKSEYFYTLMLGIIITTTLLLTFNAYLLNAQRKRTRIEASLQDTEERLSLAMEGTQDGIFDWDIKHNKVFYSRQFFGMLGYDDDAATDTIDKLKDLIHKEDLKRVWKCVDDYLAGRLTEFTQGFRMKHENGRWLWVQSRAKALFDKSGKPYRMVGAHTDITHLVNTQKRLEAEKNEAEAANRAKSDFLAHMSHEIRTPLTAISGIAEILTRNQDNLDHRQKEVVKTLQASSFVLKELVNDILDFSKIESGELELEEMTFDLEDIFEEVTSMMSLRADEKGVSFVFDYSQIKDNDFYGDPIRLRQILVNLISNGLKFTDKGSVKVKASFEDCNNEEFLRIDVSDTGIGIAPENFDLIFERFKQADNTVSRKYGGTGLGLPISRNLAQLMGGNIFLSSEVGKGSSFTLLIPQKIEKVKAKKATAKNLNKKLNSKIQASLQNETKILLVEDYAGNVVVIGYILDDIGLSYDVAKTGVEALDLWSKNHYDIILMDIQMPEMDGFTATEKIRKLEKKQKLDHTPIIGMTAHALVGDKDKCIAAGMDAYLPKPIVEADLKKEILHYLDPKKMAA